MRVTVPGVLCSQHKHLQARMAVVALSGEAFGHLEAKNDDAAHCVADAAAHKAGHGCRSGDAAGAAPDLEDVRMEHPGVGCWTPT